MTLARALLVSLRPRQWAKNALLLAPLIFAVKATDPVSVRRALIAVVAFCLLASAVYLGNDLADRERDRAHPVKRERPVAAGLLPPAPAATVALGRSQGAGCDLAAGRRLATAGRRHGR